MEEMKDTETIGLKTVIVKYLLHWKLFLGAFLFSIIPAVLYLVYYPRTYEINARVKIQEDKDLGGGSFGLGEAAGLMKSFGLGSVGGGAVNIEDELSMFTSNKLIRSMVLDLGINVEYCEPWTFGYRLYGNETLFKMTADSLTNATLDQNVDFVVKLSGGRCHVTAEAMTMDKKTFDLPELPATIELPVGKFRLALAPGHEDLKEAKMEITYRPASFVAEDLADEFLIEESSKTANVIELGCTDYERARGKDMLNTLIRYYNEEALSYQKSEATKTLAFLDGRIENLLRELATIEDKIEAYKTKVQLMDGEHDVQFYVEQMKELQTKLIELEGQANVVDLMAAFVKDTANRYAMVPMLLTLDAGGEGNPLSDYNTILLERSRVIKNSSINNPLVGTLSKQADQLRVSVIKTITNTQEGLQASLKDIRSKVAMIYDKMGSYPVAERQYVELKRDQEITQGVYLLLLQKREETALVLGKMNEKAKVLDDAYVKSRPIGPRKLYAALAMMLLTIIIPVGFLCCKQMYIALKDEFLRQKSER